MVTMVAKESQFHSDICKKTSRIVAAIFVVTDLVSDNNPISQKLRIRGVDFMSFTVSSHTAFSRGDESFLKSYSERVFEMIALLEVGFLSNQVSEMNFKVVSSELSRLVILVERALQEPQAFSFPSNDLVRVFEKKSPHSYTHTQKTNNSNKRHLIGHINSNKNRLMTDRVSDNSLGGIGTGNSRISRKDIILSALKEGKHLGIKDFLSLIPDVSEKTVQRELMALVVSGVLKKEGERRWSRYFLAGDV